MSGFDTTAADALLKEEYGPALVDELNESTPALKLFKDKSGNIPFVGREWVVPIHTGRTKAIGAVKQGNVLPTPDAQKYADYKVQPISLYASIMATAQAIKFTRNDRGAFGRAMTLEMDGALKTFRVDLNFQWLNDGTGARASAASYAGATMTLTNPVAFDVLNADVLVDVYDSTLATQKGAGLTVSIPAGGFDPSTWTVSKVTLSSTPTGAAAGDIIVRSGNLNGEVVGLNKIAGGGVYGGIDPATVPVWQSVVLDNSANGHALRAINESLFQQACDTTEIAGGEQPEFWFTTPGIRRQFFLFKTAQNRNAPTTKKYDGGFNSIEYDGKEIFADRMATANKLFGVNANYLYTVQTEDAHWIDDDGRILYRDPARKDQFIADLRYFVNVACTKRNSLCVISDLQQ